MCPQRQAKCGATQTIDLKGEGETKEIAIRDLKAGESCTFKVDAQCGAPGFQIKDASTATALRKVQVSFVEFNLEAVTMDSSGYRPKVDTKFVSQG